MNLLEIKQIIESNPVVISTVTEGNKPNAIVVSSVKVVSDTEIVATDNQMNRTKDDILKNKNICLLFWDKEYKGAKILGTVEYFTDGKWKKFVEGLSENKGYSAKGALLISVEKIISFE